MNSVTAGAIGGLAIVLLLGAFVIWILTIVARWKLFTKAGEAGWKSIIPIYSDYIQWRIGWKEVGLFWAYFGLVIVGSVLMSLGGLSADQIAGAAAITIDSLTNPVLVWIGVALMIAGVVISLFAAYKLLQSFGYGTGMFIAYLFVPTIVLLVLGFGPAQWRGAQS